MAVFGGVVADRIGFRRALSSAYLILTCAYFLVGSIGAALARAGSAVVPLGLLAGVILFLPALGVAWSSRPGLARPLALEENVPPSAIRSTIRWSHRQHRRPFLAAGSTTHAAGELFMLAAAERVRDFFTVLLFFKGAARWFQQGAESLAQVGAISLRCSARALRAVSADLLGYWSVSWRNT